MAVMVNANAPYSGLSNLMAMQGRYGDTELVHMSKPEIRGLASLGKISYNPDTGLPEAFGLGNILGIAGGIVGSFFGPVGAAIGSGLGSFGGGLIEGKPVGEAALSGVMSGVLSYGIGSALSGLGDAAAGAAGAGVGAAAGAGSAAGSAAGAGAGIAEGVAGMGAEGAGSFASFGDWWSNLGSEFAATPAGTSLAGVSGYTTFPGELGLTPADTSSLMINTPSFDLTAAADLGYYSGELGADVSSLTSQVPAITSQTPTLYSGELGADASSLMPQGGSTPSMLDKITGYIKENPLKSAGLGVLGLSALSGMGQQEAAPVSTTEREEPESGFGTRQLVGGEVIRPPKTSQEILEEMTSGGYTRRFTPYRYVAKGGLVGLQQGGMPMAQPQMQMPQQTSAMAAMAQQPVMVQPVPQPQPQQQMPTPTPQAVQPFDPVQQYRQTYMEVEGERNRKQAAGLAQQVAMLSPLVQEGMQQQVGAIPQKPYVPPTNYGSQVNLGAGFNQGGLIRLAEGGIPSDKQEFKFPAQFTNTLKSSMSRGEPMGLTNNKFIDAILTLTANNMYQQNPEMFSTGPSNMGGASTMNQLLNNPAYTKGSEVNLGAGYNRGGIISLANGGQSKYFEGQVEVENGDGMSDEVLFDVEGNDPDMALLSRDEYVLPADVVAMIGNGSSNAGSDKLDDFVEDVREMSFGTRKQQKQMNAEKGLQKLVS
jgi:hypothetical protein